MTTEQDLEKAAHALGEATMECTPEERDLIRKLYEEVQAFSAKQTEKGILVDKAAFFAAGIVFHPGIHTEAVVNAAVGYIDLDYLFVKERKDQAETTPS